MPVPKQFNGQELALLRTALIDVFPSPFDVNPFLADRLDRNLFQFAPPYATYDNQLFELLTRANAQAWIADLVAKALEAVPNNPKLREFALRHGFGSISEAELADAHQRSVQAGVEFLDLSVWRAKLGEVEARVCRLEVGLDQGGMMYGTGFLLGPSVVMTNHHVMEPVYAGLEGTTTKQGYSAKPDNVTLRFDYKRLPEGVLNEGLIYQLDANWNLDRSPSHTPVSAEPPTDHLDYALLRLNDKAGEHTVGKKGAATGQPRGHFVARSPYGFAADSPVFIVQHPQGDPLKIAFSTNGVISMNGNATRVRYRTNTEAGSSGSPCFTQDLELVALHHAGDPNFDRDARWNQGIPFAAILGLMDQHGTRKHLGT